MATATAKPRKSSAKGKKKRKKEPQVSYYRKPEDMSMQAWQVALRKQFAGKQDFQIKNLGTHPVWSDFKVRNGSTGNSYRVALRSRDIGKNFCSCMDFKTNRLGTCKHIEAVFQSLQNKSGFKKLLKEEFQPEYSSFYLEYREQRKVKLRIGSQNLEQFEALAAKYFDPELTLKEEYFSAFSEILTEAGEISSSFRCYPDALDYIIELRDRHHRTRILEARLSNGHAAGYFSQLIKADLYPYQKEGVLRAVRAGRCLLADEMGLGKTLQAIAAAELMKKEFGISSVLIVCPTSLKYQWKSEIERFSGSTVAVVEGSVLQRKEQYAQDEFYKIVSYHVARNDARIINQFDVDLVILDEAQRIKNWDTQMAVKVKKLQSPYALVLTGTPLENKLEELYSIMEFVDGFRLGPIYEFLDSHQVKDEAGKLIGYQRLKGLGESLSDVLIRRTKKQVLLQLPERMDKNLFVPMTEMQADYHESFQETVNQLVRKWRRHGFLREQDRQILIRSLNCMRMVSDSTYILDQETRHDTKIEELMNLLEEMLQIEDEKVVIFSQWERMTRLVARELDQLEIGYQYLHGGIPSPKRKALFDHFNQDADCRVFLSTDAGGVGLNLQSAAYVVNLDIPWNPAVLEQRIARVHRLGQKKNVSVVNLVSIGTIEHRMLNVLKFKSGLAEGILDDGEDTIFMEGSKFKQFMKTVEDISTPAEGNGSAMGISNEEDAKAEKTVIAGHEPPQNGHSSSYAGDDDVAVKGKQEGLNGTGQPEVNLEPAAEELLSTGMRFFSNLTKTLSDKEATQKLVASIVEKDRDSGKTYLKIPVENQEIVENGLKLLGGLLKGLGK